MSQNAKKLSTGDNSNVQQLDDFIPQDLNERNQSEHDFSENNDNNSLFEESRNFYDYYLGGQGRLDFFDSQGAEFQEIFSENDSRPGLQQDEPEA